MNKKAFGSVLIVCGWYFKPQKYTNKHKKEQVFRVFLCIFVVSSDFCLEHYPNPLERIPKALERNPMALERTPNPLEHIPTAFSHTQNPLEWTLKVLEWTPKALERTPKAFLSRRI